MIVDKTHKYLSSGRSWHQRPVSSIKKITVHHSAIPLNRYKTAHGLMSAVQSIHTSKGWPGLSYHYVIFNDGTIYQTNSHADITWHDSINDDSLGILVNGYFHPTTNDQPTEDQKESLQWLLDKLCTQHPEFPADRDDVVGHRERKPTACPGDNLQPLIEKYRAGKKIAEKEPMSDCREVELKRDQWWSNQVRLFNAVLPEIKFKEATADSQVAGAIQTLEDERKAYESCRKDVKQLEKDVKHYKKELETTSAELNDEINSLLEQNTILQANYDGLLRKMETHVCSDQSISPEEQGKLDRYDQLEADLTRISKENERLLEQQDVWADIKKRLSSRKLWLSLIAAVVPVINELTGSNLSPDTMILVVGSLLAFVGVEGIKDVRASK